MRLSVILPAKNEAEGLRRTLPRLREAQPEAELIVVADNSKLGKVSSAYVAPVNRINTLVTDRQADPQILDEIRALGVQVIAT